MTKHILRSQVLTFGPGGPGGPGSPGITSTGGLTIPIDVKGR